MQKGTKPKMINLELLISVISYKYNYYQLLLSMYDSKFYCMYIRLGLKQSQTILRLLTFVFYCRYAWLRVLTDLNLTVDIDVHRL
jgi:hypothetical protein